MARKRRHAPLRVLQNNQLVGHLSKEPGGAIEFRYETGWLTCDKPIPVSLSLPLREETYRGAPVVAVFENLLPDSDRLRRMVAQRVGADGTDAYSLLTRIGRDCIGALQFLPDDVEAPNTLQTPEGEVLGDEQIEHLLNNLAQSPLGLDENDDFRISVAGAQEKTALLRHAGRWLKPHGTTPTTHIFKTQIGTLPNGVDLTNSVENEHYCLKLLEAFGLPVARTEIHTFGKTKALVVERFDRQRLSDGTILRLPQEDFCQALSCPPARKYQSEGGPGMVAVLHRLKGSDTPAEDQKTFLKAQILFWLIGATDGHAKNFSLYLGPYGSFSLAPLYDVLTAQPLAAYRKIERRRMKLAMSVGDDRHYRIDEILGRHYVQTTLKAGISERIVQDTLEDVASRVPLAMSALNIALAKDFPDEIKNAVADGIESRLRSIRP